MTAKFGPAGNSQSFQSMGYKHTIQGPEYILKMGLDAYEMCIRDSCAICASCCAGT